jgi:hypothetical protein
MLSLFSGHKMLSFVIFTVMMECRVAGLLKTEAVYSCEPLISICWPTKRDKPGDKKKDIETCCK